MMQDPFLFNFLEDIVVVAATFTVPLPGAFVRQAIGSTQRCGCNWWFRTGFWHDAMAVWCMDYCNGVENYWYVGIYNTDDNMRW